MQQGPMCDQGTLPGGACREIWGLLFKDNRSFSVSKGKGCSRLSEEGWLEGSGVRVKAQDRAGVQPQESVMSNRGHLRRASPVVG